MKKKTNPGLKIICLNRKASFNYFFHELIEAGIVLKGSEIKSIRSGKINIADSYAVEKDGEIVLINSHISLYKQASYTNHNPVDERKLLFNKKQINKLIGKIQKEGFAVTIEDGRLWVFADGSESHNSFLEHGEPAKCVVFPAAGPIGMTVKGADADVINAYLRSK